MPIFSVVFHQKCKLAIKSKKEALQECLELQSFLDDVDDNNGGREMTQFLILSLAGTTARLLDSSDEGQTWRSSQSGLSQEPQQHSENR